MSSSLQASLGFRKHHHPIDFLAAGNALFNGMALYPQLYKVVTTKQVQNLATTTFLMMFVANIVWIMYGIHRKDVAIILSSILILIASGSLLVLTQLYA